MTTSALQKFRSFFNFGDARQKNGETLTAIHHAILNDPNFAAPDIRAEALRLLSEIRTDRAIGAAQVRTIMHTLDSLTRRASRTRWPTRWRFLRRPASPTASFRA